MYRQNISQLSTLNSQLLFLPKMFFRLQSIEQIRYTSYRLIPIPYCLFPTPFFSLFPLQENRLHRRIIKRCVFLQCYQQEDILPC